ncbi:MAG: efflux RND transporter periplasmic adaptor subunit [Polyangia bacterium]
MSEQPVHQVTAIPSSRSFTLGLGVGGLSAAALTVLSVWLHERPLPPSPPPFQTSKSEVVLRPGLVQPIPFDLAEARLGPRLPPAPLTARVVALEPRTAPSFAPLDGRIERAAVRPGDHVAAGDRVALIRSGDLAGLLRELRASAASAQTKRALTDRVKLLVEARGASANDLLVAQDELRGAELLSRAADARLKSLAIASEGDNLYWLLAPRAGVVLQIEAAPGQQVGPGKDKPVVTIADLDEVLVLADVPQPDASTLSVGDAVDLRAPGDNADLGDGQIETVSQIVDPERQTVPIRIRAKNPEGRLRPNSFITARFVPPADAGAQLLRVPSDAVVSDGLQAVVFVQLEPGRFRRTPVTIGRQQDGVTEIRSGLRAGERVVAHGALLLLNALTAKE